MYVPFSISVLSIKILLQNLVIFSSHARISYKNDKYLQLKNVLLLHEFYYPLHTLGIANFFWRLHTKLQKNLFPNSACLNTKFRVLWNISITKLGIFHGKITNSSKNLEHYFTSNRGVTLRIFRNLSCNWPSKFLLDNGFVRCWTFPFFQQWKFFKNSWITLNLDFSDSLG